MKSNNKNEFSDYISVIKEALDKGDFKVYEVAKGMLDEAVKDARETEALKKQMNTTNFGILNHIFEEELPRLIKENKAGVKNVIKLVKEDKNLRGQFNLYNAIKTKYNGNVTNIAESSEVLDRLVKAASDNIDKGKIAESNKKFRNVLIENNIIPTEFVPADEKKLYEAINNILVKRNTTSDVVGLMEDYHVVSDYMEKHKNERTKNSNSFNEIVENFENNLKTNLNESEIAFVKEITDFKSPLANKRKEKLFNSIKEQCLKLIDSMTNEDTSNDELKNIRTQISEMKFNSDTIVSDIAKLMEIRDVFIED